MEYRYTLKINGMMCGMCEAHINDVIRRSFKIRKVTSSYHKNQAIIISEELLDEQLIKDKIKETGYIVEDIKKEDNSEKKGFFAKLFHK